MYNAELYLTGRYMMCLDKEDLYERAVWDGAAGTSRRQLLERLQGESPFVTYTFRQCSRQCSSRLR
jgi:hypothetical protein